MKVLFLDMDGVIVTHRSWKLERVPVKWKASVYRLSAPDPDCVKQLNRITEATGAKIVVSSTWRMLPCIVEALALFGITGEVIGKTPDLNSTDDGNLVVSAVVRGFEIKAWLKQQDEQPESIVILDDDADMDTLLPYLVRTKFERGLMYDHADAAIRMLQTVKWPGSACVNIYK